MDDLRRDLALARLRAAPPDVAPTELPDLGPSFNVSTLWHHHVALLEHQGLADVG